MANKVLNKTICLKRNISEKEYTEINQLKELFRLHDKTNLKLELEYKLNMSRSSEIGVKSINEFLYYVEDILVAYLGISSFGGSNVGEINGMTHPDFQRQGLFKKLFELAMDECRRRSFSKLLLLSSIKTTSMR